MRRRNVFYWICIEYIMYFATILRQYPMRNSLTCFSLRFTSDFDYDFEFESEQDFF